MNGWMLAPLLLAMTALYAGGGYYLSLYAKDKAGLAAVFGSFALYGLGNLFYLVVIKAHGYGLAVTLSGVAVTIVNLGVAVLIMGERFSILQMFGAAVAVIGVTLILIPSSGITS